jgi:hypothetical protein
MYQIGKLICFNIKVKVTYGEICFSQLKEFDKLQDNFKKELINICNRSITVNTMNSNEKQLIRDNSLYLNSIANSLSKIYLSCSSWDYKTMINFYAYIRQYESLNTSEALELLLP